MERLSAHLDTHWSHAKEKNKKEKQHEKGFGGKSTRVFVGIMGMGIMNIIKYFTKICLI